MTNWYEPSSLPFVKTEVKYIDGPNSNKNQEFPKHFLIEFQQVTIKPDCTDAGGDCGLLGSCLKKALTAPETPSSDCISFASSTARFFTFTM